MKKYLLMHWNGHQSFKQTFLLNTASPILILLAFQQHLIEPLIPGYEHLRTPALVFFAVIYLAILVTSIVSTNRSHRLAGAHTYGAGYYVMACNTGVFLAACTVVVNLADLRTVGIDTPNPIKHAFTPVKLSFDENDDTIIYLTGLINPFTPDRLDTFIANNKSVRTLILDSSGGHIFAARAIGSMVQRRNMNTHVEHQCFSACTLIFIQGERRTLSDNAGLGFHGYQYLAGSTLYADVEIQQQHDAGLFSSQGVADQFISKIFATPADELWRPPMTVLKSSGVITHQVPVQK